MSKKLIAACMAIAAFAALAVASTASAAPVLTQPTGTVVPTGTAVVGKNVTETKMTTSLGTVTCSSAVMEGTVSNNATASGSKGTVTNASFTGTGSEGECTSWTGGVSVTAGVAGGLPWCLEATTSTDVGKVRGGKCSEVSRGIKFALDFTSIGTCVYNRSTAAEGSLTTDVTNEVATVSLEKQTWTKVEGGGLCPSEGSLDMTFALQTSGGSSMYFSS